MASMMFDEPDDHDNHPAPMSLDETIQKYRQLYSEATPKLLDKFVNDLYRYYDMFPYVDRKLVEKMIYENWYEITQTGTAPALAELEARNMFLRYSTLSKYSITNDEPSRSDLCRDEKTLDAILPTVPTDICKMVLSYGIWSVPEIVDLIYQSVNAVATYGNQYVETCLFPNDNARFYIYQSNPIDVRDRELICEIFLTRTYANVNPPIHSYSKVFFTPGNLKDRAIDTTTNKMHFCTATVAIIVKIILMWRSYTM